MAKGARGGKRTSGGGNGSGVSATSTRARSGGGTSQSSSSNGSGGGRDSTQTQQAQAQQGATQMASGGAQGFSKLNSDQQAQMIESGINTQTPNFLSDSDFQKFMFAHDLDGKPQVVDDKTLDSMKGKDLFRNVNAVYDKTTDVGYKADEIAQQIQFGDFTRFSDNGGSAHGRGLYFANDYGGSSVYGRTPNNVKQTAVIRAKLNNNAKVMYEKDAIRGADSEIQKGTKLGQALSKCSYKDQRSIYALAKGYNVISRFSNVDAHNNYLVVLDRSALSVSSSIKSQGYSW